MKVTEMIKRLQDAVDTKLGAGATVYVLVGKNELYKINLSVLPKGDLGPGSVLLECEPVR
jgi:hypothetical protein